MTQGTLFYVIGPSGAGKDALLTYARQQIGGQLPILFAHRYITRAGDAEAENHVSLTEAEFAYRQQLGLFALSWHSHQYWYGIGSEINWWMKAGVHVVVNRSREYLPQARERFPHMRVILLKASDQLIRQRLVERGRETEAEINARIEHNHQLARIDHPHLRVLSNDTPLEETAAHFIDLLKQ